MRKERLKQQDILDYLEDNPGSTETEIQIGTWGYYRSKKISNKKYADILRRALYKGSIKRIKVRDKSNKIDKSRWRYCLASQSFDIIFKQIKN